MKSRYSPIRIAIALLVTVLVLAPLWLMVATSLKPNEQQILFDFGNWRAFWVNPFEASLVHYQRVLVDQQAPFLRFMFNSVLIVVSIVVVGIFLKSYAHGGGSVDGLNAFDDGGNTHFPGNLFLIVLPVSAPVAECHKTKGFLGLLKN